jgi:hypothetical protein
MARGERALVSATTRGALIAVATTHALYAPEPDGSGGVAYDRLPWHDVLGATWDAEAEALRLEVADGPRRERRVLVLDEPGLLPETVRERVQASIVLTRHVPLVGRRGVRVVARRAAGSDELVWHVVPDAGVDPDHPDVRDAVALAVRAAREEVGG